MGLPPTLDTMTQANGNGVLGKVLPIENEKSKTESSFNKDDEDGERDATTYHGIYLPTLTNRFKEKKLETAYQRYACRQVIIKI